MRLFFFLMLAFGCIAALSNATALPDRQMRGGAEAQSTAMGPTLVTDIRMVSARGTYLDVEARFVRTRDGAPVVVLPITLKDGETAAFSVPGFPEQTFHFARTGGDVLVEVQAAGSLISRLQG